MAYVGLKLTFILFAQRDDDPYLSSMTRFGEISPLWQSFNSLWGILVWYLAIFCTGFGKFMLQGKRLKII